uniref:CSON007852 protein n=1 Tax=Culicoides sonorensis TaxID=179676 RepID=A0A336KDJ3_CULSO
MQALDDPSLSPQSNPLISEDIPSVKKQKLSPEEMQSLEIYNQHFLAAQMRYPQMPAAFRPWALQQQLAAVARAQQQQQQQPPPPPSSNAVNAINPKRRIQMLPFNPAINPEVFTEPPILQNPDKVVRISDSQQFQSSLQPNVALAPRKMVKEQEQRSHHHHHQHHHSQHNVNDSREKDERNNGERNSRERPPSIDRTINIKTEPQIKQEPPGTPPDMLQSPDIRYSPAGTTTHSHHHLNQHRSSNNVTPVSPQEVSQSGSNEITSSTSPVPAIKHDTSTNIIKKQESLSPSPPSSQDQDLHHHQMHRHHNSHMVNHHHQMLHTGGNVHQQSDIGMHHNPTMTQIRRGTPIPTENIHHRSQQLSTSSSVSPPTKINGIASELELSTDTDDESIAGEPDSSNTPYEIPSEFLKDVQPDHREKLINVIKALVRESVTARQENETIRIELQRKCDQYEELLQKYKSLQQQFDLIANSSGSDTSITTKTNSQIVHDSSVIAKTRPDINNFNNNKNDQRASPSQSPSQNHVERRNGYMSTPTPDNTKPTSEIIIKPFKKSLRRSPEETVVIMQPKREGEIKILTNGELTTLYN